ncbi:hypothetical protein R21Y_72 [Vibrio phage vB_VhaS_R21Y]|nr:hypothetical protein vBVcaS_HC030 [Vibrio phage vB_VcaS_HC]WKV32833.1 hypothetical protein R21Y_72 [Vibrio phage vB_VhaS_R21Y]
MNTLDTLRDLLGVGERRTAGTVQRIGATIQVATSAGVMIVPAPSNVPAVGDLVIIESNQITHNLGRETEIPIYDT